VTLKWYEISSWESFQALIGMLVQCKYQRADQEGRGQWHCRRGRDLGMDAWVQDCEERTTTVISAKHSCANPNPNWKSVVKEEFDRIEKILSDETEKAHEAWKDVKKLILSVSWDINPQEAIEIQRLRAEHANLKRLDFETWSRSFLEGELAKDELSHLTRFFGLVDKEWNGVLPWPIHLSSLKAQNLGQYLLAETLPFINREDRLEELEGWLAGDKAACILSGISGWGRTRLAIETGRLATARGRNTLWIDQGLFQPASLSELKGRLLVIDDFDLWNEDARKQLLSYLAQLRAISETNKYLFVIRANNTPSRVQLRAQFGDVLFVNAGRADEVVVPGQGRSSLAQVIAQKLVPADATNAYTWARTFDTPSAMVNFLDSARKTDNWKPSIEDLAKVKVEEAVSTLRDSLRESGRKILQAMALLNPIDLAKDSEFQALIKITGASEEQVEETIDGLTEAGFVRKAGRLRTIQPKYLVAQLAFKAAIRPATKQPSAELDSLLAPDESHDIHERVIGNLLQAAGLLGKGNAVKVLIDIYIAHLADADNYTRHTMMKSLANLAWLFPKDALLGLRTILEHPREYPDKGPLGIGLWTHQNVLKEAAQVFEPLLVHSDTCCDALELMWSHWCSDMRSMYGNYQPNGLVSYRAGQAIYDTQLSLATTLLRLVTEGADAQKASFAFECVEAWLADKCEVSGSISRDMFSWGTRALSTHSSLEECRRVSAEILRTLGAHEEDAVRLKACELLREAYQTSARVLPSTEVSAKEQDAIFGYVMQLSKQEREPGTAYSLATVFDSMRTHEVASLRPDHASSWSQLKDEVLSRDDVALYELVFADRWDDPLDDKIGEILIEKTDTPFAAILKIAEVGASEGADWWKSRVAHAVAKIAELCPQESWEEAALAMGKDLPAYLGAVYAAWRRVAPEHFWEAVPIIAKNTSTEAGLATYGSPHQMGAGRLNPKEADLALLESLADTVGLSILSSASWVGPLDGARTLQLILRLLPVRDVKGMGECYNALTCALFPLGSSQWEFGDDCQEHLFELLEKAYAYVGDLSAGQTLYRFRKFYGQLLKWDPRRTIRFFKLRIDLDMKRDAEDEGSPREDETRYAPIPYDVDHLIPDEIGLDERKSALEELLDWEHTVSAAALVCHPRLFTAVIGKRVDELLPIVTVRISASDDPDKIEDLMTTLKEVSDCPAKMACAFEAIAKVEELTGDDQRAVAIVARAFGNGVYSSAEDHYGKVISLIEAHRDGIPEEQRSPFLMKVVEAWKSSLLSRIRMSQEWDEERTI
jgi:hypothetical protein